MVQELPTAHAAYRFARRKIVHGPSAAGTQITAQARSPAAGKSRSARQLDPQEFHDLCGARQALETYAAGLAAQNWTEAQLGELRRPLQAMQRILDGMTGTSVARAPLDELVREDIRFHLGIVEIAGNAWLKEEILRLQVIHRVTATALRSKPIHTLEEHRRVQASHEEIFAAIAGRDSAAAKDAMDRHLQNNAKRFRA